MESPDWTGLYLGVYGGGGGIVDNIELPGAGPGNANGLGGEGVLGGVMGGYNYQMNNIVLGLQGELGYNDLKSELNFGPFSASARQGFVAALSARAGLLVTPDTLAYIIGGYSHSDYKAGASGLGSVHEKYHGFHVGGGLETMLTSNITLRAEYRYTSYSGEDWGTGGFLNIEPSSHTGTMGLAYNFGGGHGTPAAAADYAQSDGDWNGLYAGFYGGGGAIVDELKTPLAGGATFNGVGGEGALGGVMAGYNHQINNIVLGLQGEVGYNDLATELNIPAGPSVKARQGLVAALSARAGVLVTPDTLAYIIGGYSHSDYKFTSNFISSQKETYNGFHVGGGLETKIGSNVTLRAEYRYTGYGSEDWGTGGVIKVSPSSHTGTVGLAWQF